MLDPDSKKTSSVQSNGDPPPFGSRFLTADSDVWSKSAWDHVPPPADQGEIIASSLARQRNKPVPEEAKAKYNGKPSKYWNDFYENNANNFFKDRKWLHLEFPDLVKAAEPDAGEMTVLEVGCGAGNAVFPLLAANKNPHLHLIACDYAPKAVKVVQANPLYTKPPVGKITASVWDLASQDSLPDGVTPNSVDIIVLIFVLSALSPAEWKYALRNIYDLLKPNGLVLLRDYGRHDLTQLRFKEGRLLGDNFYIRGDGTRVYFFEIDELAKLFTGSSAPSGQVIVTETSETQLDDGEADLSPHPPTPLPTPIAPSSESTPDLTQQSELSTQSAGSSTTQLADSSLPPHPLFTISQLGVDRRLLVNRKRQLKMYRVWMQGQFRKIARDEDGRGS